MLLNHFHRAALVAVGFLGLAGTSMGASLELKFDINSLTTQGFDSSNTPGFSGGTGSGHLSFASNANSSLLVSVNDLNGVTYVVPVFQSLSGNLNFAAGQVTGGTITFSIVNPDHTTDSYAFGVKSAGPTDISGSAIRGYSISANTFADPVTGGFVDGNGDNKFGTTNITPWEILPILDGTFLHFNYHPDANGLFTDSDMEVYIPSSVASAGGPSVSPVPLPGAVWTGLPILAGMGLLAIRRRIRTA